MLKTQLEILIKEITEHCNYCDGPWPYTSNEEYAAASARQELAEEILDLINTTKDKK